MSASVCRQSGMLAGPDCTDTLRLLLPSNAMRSRVCPYHRQVRLSADGRYRIEDPGEPARTVSMFILPPAMAWYYKQQHPEYAPLPPLRPAADVDERFEIMRFIYPSQGSVVSIPRHLDGEVRGATFTLAHVAPSKTVFWHLDGEYLGTTCDLHKFRIAPPPGIHRLTVVDEDGNTLSVEFRVV